MHELPQVLPVARLRQRFGSARHLLAADPALAEGDLLETGDLDALPVLDGRDKLARFENRFMRSGVEPGITAAQNLHLELARGEIGAVDVGNLQLATSRRLDAARDARGIGVEKIKPGHR